jgi:hypothetical protein
MKQLAWLYHEGHSGCLSPALSLLTHPPNWPTTSRKAARPAFVGPCHCVLLSVVFIECCPNSLPKLGWVLDPWVLPGTHKWTASGQTGEHRANPFSMGLESKVPLIPLKASLSPNVLLLRCRRGHLCQGLSGRHRALPGLAGESWWGSIWSITSQPWPHWHQCHWGL